MFAIVLYKAIFIFFNFSRFHVFIIQDFHFLIYFSDQLPSFFTFKRQDFYTIFLPKRLHRLYPSLMLYNFCWRCFCRFYCSIILGRYIFICDHLLYCSIFNKLSFLWHSFFLVSIHKIYTTHFGKIFV